MHGLDAPLSPGDPGEGPGAGFLLLKAGDSVDDLLADQAAVGVVAVAALGGVAAENIRHQLVNLPDNFLISFFPVNPGRRFGSWNPARLANISN